MTLQTQIVYVIGAILLLYILKPILLFKPNGKPRLYGLGYDEEGYKQTLYTFQFIIIVIVLVITLFIKN